MNYIMSLSVKTVGPTEIKGQWGPQIKSPGTSVYDKLKNKLFEFNGLLMSQVEIS